jgi:uncharacterized protein YjdB
MTMSGSIRLVVLAFAAAGGVAACGDHIEGGPEKIVGPSFALLTSPAYDTISIGGTVRLTATVTTSAGSNQVVAVWRSVDSTTARVDSTGLVTGVRASPGTAVCANVSNNGADVENCAEITVRAAP